MSKQYSFDTPINRVGSNCVKHDRVLKEFGARDVIPLWVADMDFATPDFIMNAIRKRCEHEVLGYPLTPEGWFNSIHAWLKKRYDWNVSSQETGFLPGIVAGVAFVVRCFTNPGDKILIQTPVYPPFFHIPRKNNREVVINPLRFENGRFEIDFDDFELKAASGCKLFILCSPHNPGGRIWTKDELLRMAEICKRHNITIVSDEIHADLSLPGQKHDPLATLVSDKETKIITLMAPSKTFNMPGLGSSFYVIQQPALRSVFKHYLDGGELSNGNIFAFTAAQAAYEHGEEWLEQLTHYLQGNIDLIDGFLKKNIPQIKACIPQASFLIWLDCRDLPFSPEELHQFFIHKAKLGLNPGYSFGAGGEGFMRLNVGCTRKTLHLAMIQLKTAVDELMS